MQRGQVGSDVFLERSVQDIVDRLDYVRRYKILSGWLPRWRTGVCDGETIATTSRFFNVAQPGLSNGRVSVRGEDLDSFGDQLYRGFSLTARLAYHIEQCMTVLALSPMTKTASIFILVTDMTHFGSRACTAAARIFLCRRIFRDTWPRDIGFMVARYVWDTRLDSGWDKAHDMGGQRMVPTPRADDSDGESPPKKVKTE